MTRTIAAANQAASAAPVILPVFFVKLEFDTGDVPLHTTLGEIAWGGDTYAGAGDTGGISPVDEDTELARSTLQLSLRGLPTDLVSVVGNEHYQGRPATLFLGYLDQTTRQLVADPVIIYKGRMDTATTQVGQELAVSLTVESRFAAWDRPLVRRYNNGDQQNRWAGDRGLEFVEQTTEKQLVWGQQYAG